MSALNRAIVIDNIDKRPNPAMRRLNHLHAPFNDKAASREVLPAISQTDFTTAIVCPDPGSLTPIGAFTPGTPMATEIGMETLSGPRSIARARALLHEAGAHTKLTRLIGRPTSWRRRR